MMRVKVFRLRGMNPAGDQRGDVALLPFGRPNARVPAERRVFVNNFTITAFTN